MTAKIYRTRTRRNAVNYRLPDEDDDADHAGLPQPSAQGSSGSWYEVKEIVAEKKGKYKILWAGLDPETNKSWPPQWVNKCDVSAATIAEWEAAKRARVSKKGLSSTAGSANKKRTSPTTALSGVNLKRKKLAVLDSTTSDISEYQPTQQVEDPAAYPLPHIHAPAQHRRPLQNRRGTLLDEIEDSFEIHSRSPTQSPTKRASDEPLIALSQISISFDREAYLQFSDFPSSQPDSLKHLDNSADSVRQTPLLQPQPTGDKLQSQSKSPVQKFGIDAVIPDSQPSFPSSAYISLGSDNTTQSGSGAGTEDNQDLIYEGAQPRSQWHSSSDNITDFLEPLLRDSPVPVVEFGQRSGGRKDWEQNIVSTQDENPPLTFASHPTELDKSTQSSILPPPSRSPSPYTGVSDHEIPYLSLSDSAMAEQQQALRTPIQAGQQPPASGKLSLRERLAQSRRGFDDAVSAYKATPTRADSFSNRLSNSPALGAQSPSPSPSLGFTVSRLSKLDSSARLGDAQLASTNARSSPMRDTLHTHNATSANIPQTLSNEQPRHDAQSELSSQPATFASQLQLSLASLPDGDRAYAPSQVAVTQMGTYSSLPLLPQLASSEHVIMLGLSCGQKETYLQNLNNKSRVIQKYCNGEVEDDPEITGIITELLKSAGRISTHLDLATDEKLNLERQDVGFALSHPKFQFLKSFFDNIRHQSLTIAVFAEPGRALDILELFFRGIKVRCRRTDGFSIFPPLQFDQVDGSITVMLASTGPEGARVLGNYASLVIALDSTFNISDEQVEKFRAHALEVGRLSPILRLVAVNTVEHVKLFLPSSSEHYLPQLMSYVAILRHQAGNLPDSYAEESKTAPRDIARTIIETIETGAITKVSIPNVPTLPIFDTPSQTSSQKSPVISPLQTSLPPHITSSHPPTVVSRVFETSQSEPTSQDIAASPEPLVSNPSVPVATQNSAPSQTTAQPPQHAGEKRRWTEIPGPQDAQVTGSQELPEKKRKVDEETLQHQTQNGDITRISDSQPNVSQVPDDTPDSQPPMDIDGSKLSRVDEAEVTVPPPPQTSDRVPSKEPIKELNNDGQVALTIREHGHTNTSIDPQVGRNNSTEISRDSMEGVIHETDQPSSRRNMNELGPGAAPQQSLPVPLQTTQQLEASNTFATQPPPDNPEHAKISDNNTREDLLASSPEPMDQTADHVQNPASEAIDGLIDPDDFEYPVFEGSAQLPMRATLNELSREELMMTFMNKAREFNSWVSSTSRLQLRFEQMREETKQLKSILSKSKKAEAASEARNQRLTAELNGLRDERNKLRQDLQQARATLISSDKPDVVKMEQLRAENEKLQEQLKSANSQLESAKSELVWARDAYQTATREGGERGKEAEELRRLNETLQRKADERAITLRQMQHENLHKVKDQQINKLKHQLSERDERIRRLENERNTIGSYKGGRQLGTRASSVPRRGSPNASRTSSPGPGALPVMSTLPAPVGRENQNRPAHVQTAGRRSNKE